MEFKMEESWGDVVIAALFIGAVVGIISNSLVVGIVIVLIIIGGLALLMIVGTLMGGVVVSPYYLYKAIKHLFRH